MAQQRSGGKVGDLGAAVDNLKTALADASTILTVQGAMGWMMRGDVTQARRALHGLSADKLDEVSAAAAALASTADEVAARQRR